MDSNNNEALEQKERNGVNSQMVFTVIEYYADYDKMKTRREMLKTDGFTCETTAVHTNDGKTFWGLKGAQ